MRTAFHPAKIGDIIYSLPAVHRRGGVEVYYIKRPEVAEYLASKQVIAVGADTWGLDVVPPKNINEPFQGHVILLKKNGIYILENMNTGPLVKDGALEFLFVLGQAKVKGAVQMIINPIAIN